MQELSPELITLVIALAIAGFVTVMVSMFYVIYRTKMLDHEERRLMIERGMVPPPRDPSGWPGVKAREQELKYQERLLRIEKGLAATASDDDADTLKGRPEYYLRRGLVAVCVGLGAAAAYVVIRVNLDLSIPDTRSWLLGLSIVAPVVTLYGLAYVLFYRSAKDRLKESAIVRGPAR
jgi:hypothetical protein